MNTNAMKLCVCSLMVCMLEGCGFGTSGASERPNMVTGEVVFADKGIPSDSADGTIVQFHPVDGDSSGPKFSGSVWEGKYVICMEEGDEKIAGGVPEGDYVVTVTPIPRLPRPIPQKYTDPKTSDIKVTVEAGSNEIEIELKR